MASTPEQVNEQTLRELVARAQRLWKQGAYDEAAAILQGLWDAGNHGTDVSIGLGLALERRGNWEQAIAHFESALDDKPTDAYVAGKLADALAASGDRTGAIRVLAQALTLGPDDAELARRLSALTTRPTAGQAQPQRTESRRTQPQPSSAQVDALRAGPPRRPSSWANVVGVVQRVDKRGESAGQFVNRVQVWNILVCPVSRDGEVGLPLGIELRGYGLKGGNVEPGEWVEVERQRARLRGGGFNTHRIINLSRGQVIRGRRW
jgi:tetratricopeptide (TPR) repeat protein